MELRITIYKGSGKYYTDEIVKNEEDLHIWTEEYKEFLRKNLPTTYSNGYIVVEDIGENQSFHNALYKYEDLFKRDKPYERIGE